MTLKQVEQLAMALDPADRRLLAENLLGSLHSTSQRKPVDLAGRWAGKFPDGLDVQADLRESRSQWLNAL